MPSRTVAPGRLIVAGASLVAALLGAAAFSPPARARSSYDKELPPLREEFRRSTADNYPDLGNAYVMFRKIQQAFRTRNPALLAQLSAFPLRFVAEGKNVGDGRLRIFRNRHELFAHKKEIFGEKMRRLILDQEFDRLFVNWQGFMFGSGELWFSGRCLDKCRRHDFRIVIINPGSRSVPAERPVLKRLPAPAPKQPRPHSPPDG